MNTVFDKGHVDYYNGKEKDITINKMLSIVKLLTDIFFLFII